MQGNEAKNGPTFYEQVYLIAAQVPPGKVVSYGQIAGRISTPRAARMVGFAMRRAPESVPWHRVLSSTGRISIENADHPAEEQASLLRAEGVLVTGRSGSLYVDMKKFGWRL